MSKLTPNVFNWLTEQSNQIGLILVVWLRLKKRSASGSVNTVIARPDHHSGQHLAGPAGLDLSPREHSCAGKSSLFFIA